MEITIENPDINNVDEVVHTYNIQHNKEYEHYLLKCHFKLIFNNNHFSTRVRSNLLDNKTMVPWKISR